MGKGRCWGESKIWEMLNREGRMLNREGRMLSREEGEGEGDKEGVGGKRRGN